MFSKFDRQDRPVMVVGSIVLAAFLLFAAAGSVFAQSWPATGWGNQSHGNSGSFGAAELPAAQARTGIAVVTGKVIDVKLVTIAVAARPETRVLGAGLAALVGGYATRNDGGLAQGAAAMLLGFAGDKIAERVSAEQRSAQEVIVVLQNGTAISVVQENESPLAVGYSVYVLGTSPMRVRKAG